MSHKVHPKSFRIKGTEDWNIRGFYGKKMPQYLEEDFLTKDFLRNKLAEASVANIEIEHSANKINIIIETARPGLIIGRGGEGIDLLQKELRRITKLDVELKVREVKKADLSARIVARSIADGIERRQPSKLLVLSAKEKVMQAGAKGVKMGTRFVTTDECDAAMSFKKNYLSCKKEDITIIDSPVGLPGRVIRNNFVNQILNGAKKPIKCPWKCLKTCNYKEVPFCIAEALINSAKGYFSEGFSFAGTNAYLADKIQTVKETFSELILEYDTLTYMKTIEKSLQFSNKSVA